MPALDPDDPGDDSTDPGTDVPPDSPAEGVIDDTAADPPEPQEPG